MTDHGTLYFLPWLRRGLAGSVATRAVDGAPVAEAAGVDVGVSVGALGGGGPATPVGQTIALRGPGEVVGLAAGQVLRTDPTSGVRDAEANYFVTVELATPDLPWMFTPAAPDRQGRLVPWLALVVVPDDGANRITRTATAPLPVLLVEDSDELPDLDESWAWAHVQCTADLAGTALADAYAQPGQFRARLLCPRRLDPDTKYLAAVVPTFDAGRRAGLGLDAAPATDTGTPGWWLAWRAGTTGVQLPVYYSWTFRTGPAGDFESLVRALRPRELDAGVRDFDLGDPGTDRLPPQPPAPRLVSWWGALVSPAARVRRVDDGYRDTVARALRVLVNEGHGTGSEPGPGEAYDPLVHDPVVGPPAYGALAIGADAVPEPVPPGGAPGERNEPVWFGQANLDPVHRSVAGLGGEVVRQDQEALLATAWSQVAGLAQINRVLNWTRLAAEVATRQVDAHLTGLPDAALVQLVAPASARLRLDPGQTMTGRLAGTSLPGQLTSAAFQRICRPDGPVGRAHRAVASSQPNPGAALTAAFLTDLGPSLGYTALIRPFGLQIGAETLATGFPVSGDTTRSAADPAIHSGLAGGPSRPGVQHRDAQPADNPHQRVGAPAPAPGTGLHRGRGPLSGVTVVGMPGQFLPAPGWALPAGPIVSRPVTVTGQAELDGVAGQIRSALRPGATLAAKLADRISAPGEPFAGRTVPAALAASPQFPDPLYERLRAIDPEFLLPGVGAIPADTVGLVSANAAFVEAFLLGANDQLAAEFRWREYPAPLGDTWLRTFWDSSASESGQGADIGPVAGWTRRPRAALGEHQTGPGATGTLVLVIRGDLLRRYPDTVIYASKAVWNLAGTDAEPVPANTRREEEVAADGTPARRLDPLFRGVLDASTVFLGFALEQAEALGPVDATGRPVPGGDQGDRDAGWFFVWEQPPTGPRFGLDVGNPGQAGTDVDHRPAYWRNVSWYHQVDTPDALAALPYARATGRLAAGAARPYDQPRASGGNTFTETWGTGASAMARITLQRPVRMLVHASAMLPEATPTGGDGR